MLTDSSYHHCWSFPPHDWCGAVFAGDGERGDFQADFTGKTCCCGAVKLSELPASCKWQSLHMDGFSAIPEAIQDLLKPKSKAQSHDGLESCATEFGENFVSTIGSGVHYNTAMEVNYNGTGLSKTGTKSHSASLDEVVAVAESRDSDAANLGTPDVCDAYLPKLKAVELAGDLVCTVLRIAYVVSERM